MYIPLSCYVLHILSNQIVTSHMIKPDLNKYTTCSICPKYDTRYVIIGFCFVFLRSMRLITEVWAVVQRTKLKYSDYKT